MWCSWQKEKNKFPDTFKELVQREKNIIRWKK